MITYSYYQDTYNGSKIISEEEFVRLARKAELYIKSAITEAYTEQDIAEAVCAISDVLATQEDSLGIKSEKADGISITYTDERTEKTLISTLKMYLPQKLLFRGL